MKQPFPFLAQRFFNTPLCLHPAKAEVVMAALAERLGVTNISSNGVPMALAPGGWDDDARAEEKSYDVYQGVAIIPVQGMLLQKSDWMSAYSGLTGFNDIRSSFAEAFNDDAVKAILLDIDSPGGEVAGCFDLVDAIYGARGKKPIWASLSENAFSAAYALASACDKICVPRTGGTGSIGVIAMVADITKALSKEGIAVNIIQFGARKADGYPEAPFTPQARARFQAQIDMVGNLFVNTVARNRNMKASAVIAQQAMTYMGGDGVQAGLADMVAAPDAAFGALLKTLKT